MEAEEANNSSSSKAPTAAAATAMMEFPDWLDVVRNDDGSVKNPATEINIHVIVDLCFLAWIGSPFNLKIVFRILGDKLLRDTSRYIIQLATMIASLCVLLTNFFSIALFIFRVKGRGGVAEIEGFCHFYVVTAGWSYISLLFNICTSLLDSFTAVVFPMWHQRKLTPRRVVLSLLGLNAAIGLIVNHHFISGRVPLRCAIQLDHSHTQNTFGMTLYVLCVLLFGVDYFIVKKMLPSRRQRRTAALTATTAAPAPAALVPRGPEEIEMNVIEAGGGGVGAAAAADDDTVGYYHFYYVSFSYRFIDSDNRLIVKCVTTHEADFYPPADVHESATSSDRVDDVGPVKRLGIPQKGIGSDEIVAVRRRPALPRPVAVPHLRPLLSNDLPFDGAHQRQ